MRQNDLAFRISSLHTSENHVQCGSGRLRGKIDERRRHSRVGNYFLGASDGVSEDHRFPRVELMPERLEARMAEVELAISIAGEKSYAVGF